MCADEFTLRGNVLFKMYVLFKIESHEFKEIGREATQKRQIKVIQRDLLSGASSNTLKFKGI